MFSFKSKIFLYVRLYTNAVLIRDVVNKKELKREAIKPFSNNRLLFADFINGEEFLIATIKELFEGKPNSTFNILIQPMEKIEGGLSSVENRALMDVAEYIGGRNIVIYDKTNLLSDNMVLEMVKNS
ncbi:MAG: hypothetical protein COW67_02145 [Flavobacteriales bacterium CG18_big_fil_WC_8_21_14_2_50_32_9]|nr:MAG: hypothetical protein COW67_02145 [Flavobacteriales bacterium CG18_big_fil_WC_8_21_14_2_50_32_9]